MYFIAWISLGLVCGFIASKVVDGAGQEPLRDMALGVLGAFVGGLMFHLIGQTRVAGLDFWSLFVPVLGAAAVLTGYHVVVGRRSGA